MSIGFHDENQVLIGGSRIVLTSSGPLRLHSGRDWMAGESPVGPTLQLGQLQADIAGYQRVLDLHVGGDRVVALVEGNRDWDRSRVSLVTTSLALDRIERRPAPELAARVAITARRVFVGNSHDVFVDDRAFHQRPRDLAATPTELAILDADGVTFYDALGARRGEVPLFAATALAVDRIEGGWLAAVDGGIVHLDSANPSASPRMITPVAEPVHKLRRGRDGMYVLHNGELRVIRGEHVEVLRRLDGGDWDDFDADANSFALYSAR